MYCTNEILYLSLFIQNDKDMETAKDLKIGDIITKLGGDHLVGKIVEIVSVKGSMIMVRYTVIKNTNRFKHLKINPIETHRVRYNINTPIKNILYKN